jgi:uncharacterized membrane protein
MLRPHAGRFDVDWRWLVGIAGFVLASLTAIAPAAAEFRVCNKSQETVDVAFGYDGGGKTGWIAEGWYTIGRGRCVTVYGGRLNGRYYYLYAEGADGNEWNGEGTEGSPFCITRKVFKLFQRRYGSNEEEDCEKHKLESKRFFEINVGEHFRWVQTLDPPRGGSPPPSAPAPPPQTSPAPPPSQPPARGSACERFPNLC